MQFLASFDIWKMGQKDARGSISPLRVEMEGVSALGGFFDAVFGIFRFLENGPKRCARVDFPPSGSNGRGLSSGRLLWCSFWHFSISGKWANKMRTKTCMHAQNYAQKHACMHVYAQKHACMHKTMHKNMHACMCTKTCIHAQPCA